MNTREMLTAYAAENGVTMNFDENGACTLPLSDDRVLHLQFRDELGELDLVALLGTVPDERRAYVFERLLAANYYWKQTVGATLSWQDDLEQVVLTYPIKVETTDEATLRSILDRFVDLQEAWAERLQREIEDAETAAELDLADLDLSELAELPSAAEEPAAPESLMRLDV